MRRARFCGIDLGGCGKGGVRRLVGKRAVILGIAAALSLSLATASALEDGRIGVLYTGCIARSAPFWLMRSDPLFSITFVQATLRDWANFGPIMQADSDTQVYRLVRLYMPRTYSVLTQSFDVIVLANANRFAVGPKYSEMFARAVDEGGLSLFMSGGWESFGAAFGRPAWGDSAIGNLLPTEDVPNTWVEYPRGYLLLKVGESNHELVTSIPWEPRAPFMNNFHHNLVKVRPGATVLAWVESLEFNDHPAMITWERANDARVFAMTGEIHACCQGIDSWEYGVDLGSNLMIYLDRRPVPQDVELVHSVRLKMSEIDTRKSLLLSLLEFCDSFGANTQSIVSSLDDIERLLVETRPVYLDLRFEEVLGAYQDVGEMLAEVEMESVALKNRALVWVYIIEWLAVTGTGMICGFVLWSTMVQRRLYRQVSATRLRGYSADET